MGLIDESDERRKYKYRCNSLYVDINAPDYKESINIPPERMTGFRINCDYINNLFPVTSINITMDDGMYYKILKYKQYVKIRVAMYKFYETFDGKERSMESQFLNKTYSLILDDADIDLYENTRREAQLFNPHAEADKTNDMNALTNKMEFYLYDSSVISAFNETLNDILIDTSLMDAMSYVLYNLNVGKVLWAQFDNNQKYDRIILQPIKGSNLIKYLDTYYGFYKTGSIIFADWDRTYIMPYKADCVVWESGEKKKTMLIVPDKADHTICDTCSLVKSNADNQFYVVIDSNNFTVRNDSISTNMLVNNKSTFTDLYDGQSDTSVSSAMTMVTSPIQRHEIVSLENEYLADIYNTQVSSKALVVETIMGDYDITSLKPNKEYIFGFTSPTYAKKVDGKFILAYADHNFVKVGEDFSLTTAATFYSEGKATSGTYACMAG